ncbi:MAG TPA: hypothetical protein VLK35_08800, partial [Methylomirabilota bacterium]|nr:hypothetical protein [Methylomirabilota bacterium]
MSPACPHCGWSHVEGTHCPRCGVDVARYRAELAARATGAAPAAPPAAVAVAAPSADAPVTAGAPPLHPAGFWLRVG